MLTSGDVSKMVDLGINLEGADLDTIKKMLNGEGSTMTVEISTGQMDELTGAISAGVDTNEAQKKIKEVS